MAVFEYVGFGGFVAEDGEDDGVEWREAGWEDEAVVVGVGHDEAADESSGYAPGCGPGVVVVSVAVEELDVAAFGEVLSEEVRCAGL